MLNLSVHVVDLYVSASRLGPSSFGLVNFNPMFGSVLFNPSWGPSFLGFNNFLTQGWVRPLWDVVILTTWSWVRSPQPAPTDDAEMFTSEIHDPCARTAGA